MKTTHPHDIELETAAATFAALGSEQRLSVLLCLVRAGPAGLSIGDLGARTSITGSTLTFHVKILAQAGLVRQVRQGRRIICAAATPEIRRLSDFLLSECCAEAGSPDIPCPTPAKDADHG